MIVLGIDTSGFAASVSLLEKGLVLSSFEEGRARSQSSDVHSLVGQCLDAAGKKPRDIQLVGISVGPGSFTGVRIGISFIMGFCAPGNIPAVALSSLEILAFAHGIERTAVRPVIDARRNEVFTALFEGYPNTWQRREEDRIVPRDECARCAGLHVFDAGSPLNPCIGAPPKKMNLATAAALLAGLRASSAVQAHSLKPVYLRASAAEEKLRSV